MGKDGQRHPLKWFVDDVLVKEMKPRPGYYGVDNPDAPFDKLFYLVPNQSVGGSKGGTPNTTAVYTTEVDYVVAYTR
jgi:beta-glucanase (GH16 family)